MKINNLVAFTILKKPLTIPVYLNIFVPVLGFFYLIRNWSINKIYFPLFIMITINLIPLIYYNFLFWILKAWSASTNYFFFRNLRKNFSKKRCFKDI